MWKYGQLERDAYASMDVSNSIIEYTTIESSIDVEKVLMQNVVTDTYAFAHQYMVSFMYKGGQHVRKKLLTWWTRDKKTARSQKSTNKVF